MTRRKERLPLEVVTVKLFQGEYSQLLTLYPKVGASKVIRELVHNHLKQINEAAAASVPAPRITDV